MISAGAEQCPICSLRSWECQHEVVRWSKQAGEFEPSVLASSVAALADLAAQALARARSLRVAPHTAELRTAYEAAAGESLDDVYTVCLDWLLDLLAAFPGTHSTDDDMRTILWTVDAEGFQRRLDDLRIRLEVEFCVAPSELRAVP